MGDSFLEASQDGKERAVREKLKGKLRSRQGMSLLLSLLLFLMCAMGGSVALTAGTASSGTVSERAKLDQRYFSVTSAVELLRRNLHEKHVSVSANGEMSANATGSAAEFLKDQSLYLLRQRGDYEMSAENVERAENAGKWLAKYEVKASLAGANADGLSATLEISRKSPEKLELTVESAIKRGADEEKETFGLRMECVASVGPAENGADGVQVNWEIGAIRLA